MCKFLSSCVTLTFGFFLNKSFQQCWNPGIIGSKRNANDILYGEGSNLEFRNKKPKPGTGGNRQGGNGNGATDSNIIQIRCDYLILFIFTLYF